MPERMVRMSNAPSLPSSPPVGVGTLCTRSGQPRLIPSYQRRFCDQPAGWRRCSSCSSLLLGKFGWNVQFRSSKSSPTFVSLTPVPGTTGEAARAIDEMEHAIAATKHRSFQVETDMARFLERRWDEMKRVRWVADQFRASQNNGYVGFIGWTMRQIDESFRRSYCAKHA
jgi:hypothetical protein